MDNQLIELFISLYIWGNRIKALTKEHNADKMSETIVLWLAHQPISTSELALCLGIKLSAMSQKINSMQKSGLLVRVKTADARINQTVITPKGKAILTETIQTIAVQCPPSAIELTEPELTTLTNLLQKINIKR